jgi:uncharacterized membrane protein YeaQ/YmgE (transglycosylase-associated protein family)
MRMLHLIAFIVIGLVVGYVFGRGTRAMWIAVVLGLIGGLAGGELLHSHRYLSLLASVIGAIILGYVGKAVTPKA